MYLSGRGSVCAGFALWCGRRFRKKLEKNGRISPGVVDEAGILARLPFVEWPPIKAGLLVILVENWPISGDPGDS